MHQRHPKALENPDRIEQRRKGKFSAFTDRTSGRSHKAHHDEAEEGDGETGGDGPLAADPVGDAAGDRKADNRSQTAQNREDHGGTGRGLEMIDDIIADVGAEGIVGHEPEKLRTENGQQHGPVFPGHRPVVINGCLNRGEAFP